ncbi:hypothetical protein ACHAWT_009769 [Skeletonema menzelii]|eukprot:scaffold1698_cov149-Skeletonema_menzelii.AAC.29
MPTTTADDDEIQIHVVPTFDGGSIDDKVKKNRLRFSRRRSSGGSSVNSRSSLKSFGSFGNMMDMFGSSDRSDDNLHQYDIDPEETFATAAPAGGNRYDPSRLTLPNSVVDFDLDGMNDDDSNSQQGLDESYVIDETTGQRFSVPSTSISRGNNKENHRLAQSPISFCKQLTGLATVPLLILLSAGLLAFAIVATRSTSSAAPPQMTDSMEILLYNTEVAVNKACTKQDADWEDLSVCRSLCRTSMCCFDMSQSTSCYQENKRSCLAHSACTAITAFPSQIIKPYRNEKEKLVLSEMILLACSRDRLDKDMGNCQKLCKDMLCCFDEEEEYNCASVKGEECLVHAGCEALVQGH